MDGFDDVAHDLDRVLHASEPAPNRFQQPTTQLFRLQLRTPVPGNSKFALGLYSAAGGDRYLLSMGLQPLTPPFDLGVAGAAGCKLFVKEVFVLVGGVTGTGNGLGKVVIPAPIPTTVPKGTKVYRQWLLGNKAPVNGAQFTVSNARLVEIK